jgi:hypothetical protein
VSHPATRVRPRIRFGTATGATSVISSTAGSSSASACVAARTAGESAGNSKKTSPSVPVVRSPGVISVLPHPVEAGNDQYRRRCTLYESSCAFGC